MLAGTRTPLALAVLELLYERPMHPYEMQGHIRERGLDQFIKLRGSSLYSTVERLVAAGLIEPVETSREGRRPERTVYALTEVGQDELLTWLRELLSEPANEYPRFGGALAFLGTLPPAEAADLLERRAVRLEAEIAAGDSMRQNLMRLGVPRLFGIEGEYAVAMRRAELDWVCGLVANIRDGALEWPPEVLALQREKEEPS